MAGSIHILPLDGEGGPRRSRGSEGVNPGAFPFKHLAPTPSTAAKLRSPSPIKGEDGCAPVTD